LKGEEWESIFGRAFVFEVEALLRSAHQRFFFAALRAFGFAVFFGFTVFVAFAFFALGFAAARFTFTFGVTRDGSPPISAETKLPPWWSSLRSSCTGFSLANTSFACCSASSCGRYPSRSAFELSYQ